MKTFKKDQLAKKILSDNIEDYDTLSRLASLPNYPEFEVRTVGAAGIVNIKFPHQGWVKPREWAINHVNTIRNNVFDALQRLEKILEKNNVLEEKGFIHESDVELRLTNAFEVIREVKPKRYDEVEQIIYDQFYNN
jgi:hypothetical protein